MEEPRSGRRFRGSAVGSLSEYSTWSRPRLVVRSSEYRPLRVALERNVCVVAKLARSFGYALRLALRSLPEYCA
jgi:hypothetical protein